MLMHGVKLMPMCAIFLMKAENALVYTYLKSCCSDLFCNKLGRLVGKKKQKNS